MLEKIRKRDINELRRLTKPEEIEIPADATPEEVLPELLRNSLGYMRWARKMVGELDTDEFWIVDPRTKEVIPGAKFELEMRTLAITKSLCETMIRFDIDKRGVQIEEAKMDILATALQEAARSAGLDDQQQKKLGAALRNQLQLIEAKAA